MDDTPVQYKKGFTGFFKLKIKVNPSVLIPRPETELLVEEVIKVVREMQNGMRDTREQNSDQMSKPLSELRVLEVGTGSGCIAISIAKNTTNVKITALDISEDALEVARENSKLHQVENRIEFVNSDLMDNILQEENRKVLLNFYNRPNDSYAFDIIVANLPYIPTYQLENLADSVNKFEPFIALDGGADGFRIYEKLFKQMRQKQILSKLFLGEIDSSHEEIAKKTAVKYFPGTKIEILKDLTKRIRFLKITF